VATAKQQVLPLERDLGQKLAQNKCGSPSIFKLFCYIDQAFGTFDKKLNL